MIQYRPLDWPRDRAALERLDTSLDTGIIYAVTSHALDFALHERPVDPPLHKRYDVAWETLPAATLAIVAEDEGRLVGVAAITRASGTEAPCSRTSTSMPVRAGAASAQD